MKTTDEQRIEKIKWHTDIILSYLKKHNLTRERLLFDKTEQHTIVTPLYNIGEHIYNLSDEFKQIHSNISWRSIPRLQHHSVYDYTQTNWSIVSKILFSVLPRFQSQIEQLLSDIKIESTDLSKRTDLSIGNVISFGRYNDTPLQWYILDNDTINHRYLLLSVDILEDRPYHGLYKLESIKNINPLFYQHNGSIKNRSCVTWAESTIRSWLNGYGPGENKEEQDYTTNSFISSAFTSEERARIPSVEIINDDNPEYGTPAGLNTTDKVFLLSITELNRIRFKVDDDSYISIDRGRWWLRSPGHFKYRAAYVRWRSQKVRHIDGKEVDCNNWRDPIGAIERSGEGVFIEHIGVRPALWLNY